MKQQKPDRFERMVEKIIKSDEDVGYDAICFPDDVIKLLRNEHAWMKRMVKDVRRWSGKEIITKDDLTTVILARLAQRRK